MCSFCCIFAADFNMRKYARAWTKVRVSRYSINDHRGFT